MIRRIRKRVLGLLGLRERPGLDSVEQPRIKRVREVMLPRSSVVALPLAASEADVHAVVRRAPHSRYPVYGTSLDDIVGVFLVRDLRKTERGAPFALARHLREPVFVPDTRPAHLVMDDLRKTQAHIAIVLDDVGGTAGIVTLGDLMTRPGRGLADEQDDLRRRPAGGSGR